MHSIKTRSKIYRPGIVGWVAQRIACVIFFLHYSISQSFSQTTLIGKWMDVDHTEKKVEMYKGRNDNVFGKSETGLVVFKELVFDPKMNHYNGVLVNPDDREEFKITIELPTTNSFTFMVRKFIFTKRFVFQRQ